LSNQKRIALIHATRVAIGPVESAAKELWPEAELVSILEEALSMDSAAGTVPADELHERIVDLARYAERLKPDGILYTCSAFGKGIERASQTSHLPVLKPNEAMFDAAFGYGDNIAMIYTFPTAVKGMEKEFANAAEQIDSRATVRSIFAEGAREALNSGDAETHNRLIADTAAGLDADAIMLAHFSMAIAASAVKDVTSIPVLTSPESAISKMKNRVIGKSG